ncbi:MAG: NAD(P)H-binding protein [Planctomycetaceae bacterium]|nr:NAD(P)H-binding protein [Planctomycetaceae bacterium]
MPEPTRYVVTGAFGFLGRHIARRLIERGDQVLSLNGRRPDIGDDRRIAVARLDFASPDKLVESLRGAAVLFNTYWIRYPMHGLTFEQAVENSRVLIAAAREAAVPRVVHISITNPSADSPLGYFRGKARVEESLKDSGLSHAILRPAALFGDEGILINNIAWALRRLPVFALFGRGRYRLQPIFVEDLAELAIEQAARTENVTLDAIGPETFTYRQLVKAIARAIGVHRFIVPAPPPVALAMVQAMGWILGDPIVTPEEMRGLMDGLLATDSPPAASTRLSDWMRDHAADLGRSYMSERARRRGLVYD